MRTPLRWLVVLGVWGATAPGWAQPPRSVLSPEIGPDRAVTFRLLAPAATRVQLQCEGVGTTNLLKDDRGVWSFTSPPLEPDIYTYSFNVDGLRITDPDNSWLRYSLQNNESVLHVPGTNALPWEVNEVPHGVLHEHFYQSAVVGDFRNFVVYTPPGYNAAAWKWYPVLYLLHGYADDASTWSTVGCANLILDNLIARGQARPMIVVMPLGYGNTSVNIHAVGALSARSLLQGSMEKFQDALLKEVMPQVEKDYKASGDRENHAIAGLSMGGTESLMTGLNHLDRFAWIGCFSAGGLGSNYTKEFPKAGPKMNPQLRLLWVSCGDHDNLLTSNQAFYGWITSQGVTAQWVETPGEHSYRVWRRNLADFAPLLFRDKQ